MGQRSLEDIEKDIKNRKYLLREHIDDAEGWAMTGYSEMWEYELFAAQSQLDGYKELIKERYTLRKQENDAFWAEPEKEEA